MVERCRYAPRAMALASDSPYFNTFSDFLHEVHRMVFTGQSPRVPIERILQFFMTDVPRPPRGYVSIQFRLSEEQEVTSQLFSLESSARNAMPKIYFDMRPTFKALTPASVVRIFGCLLLEMRVIICGSNLGLVFEACETFRQLLFPFNWQHPYIPIFAYPWMPLLRAPVPYFIGMPADLMHPELRASLLGSGVVIADLDLATLSGSYSLCLTVVMRIEVSRFLAWNFATFNFLAQVSTLLISTSRRTADYCSHTCQIELPRNIKSLFCRHTTTIACTLNWSRSAVR